MEWDEKVEKELSLYLKEITKSFNKENLKIFSANEIANKINLSRSTVSSYLNKEVKEGNIIKVDPISTMIMKYL